MATYNMHLFWLAVILLLSGLGSRLIKAVLIAPNLDSLHYVYPGDINLGVIGYLHTLTEDGTCGTGAYFGNDVAQQPEAVYYTINQVNQMLNLLPNLSLGFVFMDGCLSAVAGSARSVYFISNSDSSTLCSDCPLCTKSQTENNTLSDITENNVENFQHYRVSGIVGPPTSGEAVTVGALMSAFEIPTLGTFSSSDELSDKGRFEYFSRLVPPDNFQTQAMVDVLEYFGWSYVLVIYAEGSYGENAVKQFTKWVNRRGGICVALSFILPAKADTAEIEYIVDKLEQNKRARVVVLFASDVGSLFRELDSRNLTSHFVWFGSDTVGGTEHTDFAHLAEGTLYMTFEGVSTAPTFAEYYKVITPWTSTSGNPWLKSIWQQTFQCSWNISTENVTKSIQDKLGPLNHTTTESCYSFTGFGDDDNFRIGLTIGKLIDGVKAYALALHNLISLNCPEAFQNKTYIQDCINGEQVLKFLRNVSFQGVTGQVQFDQNGDMLGAYSIVQIQRDPSSNGYYGQPIGTWEKISETVFIDENIIQWPFRKDLQIVHTYEAAENISLLQIPPSVCSWPCKTKFYKIQQELSCCWFCGECRNNEIIINNGTSCMLCPENTWPDEDQATECLHIPESYLGPTEGIAIGLIILSLVGFVVWLVVFVVFIKNNNEKLIKASNKELSYLILCGALLSLVTVFFYVNRPTKLSCSAREVGFHMSVNILYGPLLVKTNRVYRIFESGKRGVQRPRFVSSAAQRLFTIAACLTQV